MIIIDTTATVNGTASLTGGASSASALFTLVGPQVKSITIAPNRINTGEASTALVTLDSLDALRRI